MLYLNVMNVDLTIFTPTYNRAYCLKEAYDSLLRQTNKNFVWLIVDDGSTDNTEEIIHNWIEDGKLDIEYVFQDNAGKMAAHNAAAKLCKTELFVCLDSDDQMTDTAVEEIFSFWNVHHSDRIDLIGIIAPKAIINMNGDIIRKPQLPTGLIYTTGRGLYQRGYQGETAMFFKADILRSYPFPVQEGEKFISEISAYDIMDENFVWITYNHPLMKCQYREDGYSLNLLKINVENPKGVVYVNQQRQRKIGRFSPTLMKEYIAYSLIAKLPLRSIVNYSYYPLLCALMIPIGYFEMKKILKKY